MNVSHAAVQAAQRLVGDQLERERVEAIRLRDQRRYGPHRDDDAPTTITTYGAGRWPREEERPVPDALLRQRRTINTIAYTSTPVVQDLSDASAANTALIVRLRGTRRVTPAQPDASWAAETYT